MENNEREKGCFVGLQNQKELEKTNMRFEMIIDNLNQTIANLGASMDEKFDELNKKINKIDNKIDTLQGSIPEKINEVVDLKMKNNVFNTFKWIVFTLGGSVSIAVITKFVLTLLIL